MQWLDILTQKPLQRMFSLYKTGRTVRPMRLYALAKWKRKEDKFGDRGEQNQRCHGHPGQRQWQCSSMILRFVEENIHLTWNSRHVARISQDSVIGSVLPSLRRWSDQTSQTPG